MTKSLLVTVFGLMLILGWSENARAQSPASHYINRPWEFNVHAGVILFDEDAIDETEFLAGARVLYNWPSGWGFGGNFDYSQIEDGIDVYLFSGEVDYTFGSPNRAHFFVGAGIGGANFSFDDDDDDSETELLIPIAVGVKWFNRTNDPTFAIRGDVRDNIIRFDAADETTHNIELSAGVSFLL